MLEDKTTRRSFLQLSAGALAGAALPSVPEGLASALPAASGLPSLDLPLLTLAEAASRIRRKQLSPVELVQATLDRVEKLDPKVGAFITVLGEQALADARAAEAEIRQGRYRGPLHGIPVGLKDTNYLQGVRTTAATSMLKNFVPAYDATIVRRFKEAGAVIIGKMNLPEFSFGGQTPGTHNPWDLSRGPGGSSGGPAAALAASMLLGASGGDTSGSIRNPASTCGVVGLKPTFGLVSRYGVIPISWTLDHVGPLAKTVEDTAILLRVMAGYDPSDPFSAQVPVPDYPALLRRTIRGMPVGVPPASAIENFHPDTRRAFEQAVKTVAGLGAQIREAVLPPTMPVAASAHGVIRICEAAAYHRQFLTTRPDDYGPFNPSLPKDSSVRTTVEAGSLLTGAQYLRCQQVRKVFIREMGEMFQSVDALLTPAMPAPAGEAANPPVSFRNEMNLCGFPAISVPAGFSTSPPGLPIGLQIIAKPFDDATALAVAFAYESATEWHNRHPAL